MKSLHSFPVQQRAAVRCILTDIDDTLTNDGKLTATAYAAMERWQQKGGLLIPVTGRPAGWCDHIARMWPVSAVVGENGAFYFWYDQNTRTLRRHYRDDEITRSRNRQRLLLAQQAILEAVPGCALASDQAYRVADLAIDFCEDVPQLPETAIDQIVSIMEDFGMTAKVSSIHVNGWFGDYSKLEMCCTLLQEHFSITLPGQRGQLVFIGDSANDAPLFEYFPLSVGVANIRNQLHRLQTPPTYITRSTGGYGFAELVDLLLPQGGISARN